MRPGTCRVWKAGTSPPDGRGRLCVELLEAQAQEKEARARAEAPGFTSQLPKLSEAPVDDTCLWGLHQGLRALLGRFC